MENKIIRYAITSKRPYFNLSQVEEIYAYLNGSRNGLPYFLKKAKEIAVRNPETKSYVFKDEEKLFFLLKEFLPEQLNQKKIYSFGELMQEIS